MANDYLKHYGVPKSQWSAQARSKYDAEHRRKYGDGEQPVQQGPQSTIRSRQRRDSGRSTNMVSRDEYMRSKKPRNLARTDTSSKFVTTRKLTRGDVTRATKSRLSGQARRVDADGSTVGAGTTMNRDRGFGGGTNKRVGKKAAWTSETWESLTPEQKKRANGLVDAGKRGRKAVKYAVQTFGDPVNVAGEFYVRKKIEKKDRNEAREKYAKEIKRMDDAKAAKERKKIGQASSSTSGIASGLQNGKGRSDGTTKHVGKSQSTQMIGASLPKAGFIFKRPQARTVGKELYKVTKKEAHKVKKQNDAAKKEAQDAFERHKKEAEASYAKRQREKAIKKQKKKVEDAISSTARNAKKAFSNLMPAFRVKKKKK